MSVLPISYYLTYAVHDVVEITDHYDLQHKNLFVETNLRILLQHRYHYLGYTKLPGAQLRYIVRNGDDILALLGFSAAAWKTAPRDQFIGWNDNQRQNKLNLIVNNYSYPNNNKIQTFKLELDN